MRSPSSQTHGREGVTFHDVCLSKPFTFHNGFMFFFFLHLAAVTPSKCKKKNHETIVEGQKLRKADIMESNTPHTPHTTTTTFTHNYTHNHTHNHKQRHTPDPHTAQIQHAQEERERRGHRDTSTGGQTEDLTANDMALKEVR